MVKSRKCAELCRVAQLLQRRLAVSQIRVRCSTRNPWENFHPEPPGNKEMEKDLGEWLKECIKIRSYSKIVESRNQTFKNIINFCRLSSCGLLDFVVGDCCCFLVVGCWLSEYVVVQFFSIVSAQLWSLPTQRKILPYWVWRIVTRETEVWVLYVHKIIKREER